MCLVCLFVCLVGWCVGWFDDWWLVDLLVAWSEWVFGKLRVSD